MAQITGKDSLSIRRAVRGDCERMMELIRELAIYEKAPEQVTVDIDHFRESGFGKKPVWWAFVAEWNGIIAGFALYYIRYSTWKGQRMYLEDLLVTEKARGKGIGSKLMEQLFQEAREKKFSGIMWQVLDWNTPAIEFYKKFNVSFDPEWINCTIDLSQER